MISKKWLEKKKAQLAITAPGEPHDALAAEIAEAEAQLAREEAEIAEVLRAGFKRNQYEGTCAASGVNVGPLAGFVRKESARWVTYSWAEALKLARK